MHYLIVLSLFRFLGRSKVSLGMAVLGVAIATGSIVSVHLISVRVGEQLDGLVPGPLHSYSHFLYPADDDMNVQKYAQLRRAWRSGEQPLLTDLTPVIDERVRIEEAWVRVIGVDLIGLRNADWLDDEVQPPDAGKKEVPQLGGDFTWNGVWVDKSLAGLTSQPINGLLNLPPGVLVTDISRAQSLLGWPAGRLSYLAAKFSTPSGQFTAMMDQLVPGFSAGLPDVFDPTLRDWRVVPLDEAHPGTGFGKSILFNVSALAILSLVVAWFLIYQVASSWLRRLAFLFDRLHTLGVPAQAGSFYYLFLLGVIGFIAALIGLALGAWGSQWLLGVRVDGAPAALDIWVVGKAFVCAVGVALVSGVSCWVRQYGGVTHIGFVLFWGAIGLLVVLGVAGTVFSQTGLMGGFLGIGAVAVLGVVSIAPGLRWIQRRLRWFGSDGVSGISLIGFREVFWFPRDLSIALAGLVLAIGTAIGIGLMVESFRYDFERFLDQRLAYNLNIEGSVQGSDTALRDSLAILDREPDVQFVSMYYEGVGRFRGAPFELRATSFTEFELSRYGVGSEFNLTRSILVNEQFARQHQLVVGSVIEIQSQTSEIVGVVKGFGDTQGRVLIDVAHPIMPANLPLASVGVVTASGSEVAAELQQALPSLSVTNAQALRQVALQTFDQTFVITSVLTTIAMVVAGVGLYVGVTSLRLNRRGSTTLLRSLGIKRLENLWIDLHRSLVMGLVSMVFALPVGILFGWMLCTIVNPRAFGWSITMFMSVPALIYPCLWGLLAAILAGVIRLGSAEEGAVGLSQEYAGVR
ncbi:MAG: ABC transporter permease [Pseudomonadota bacterium]